MKLSIITINRNNAEGLARTMKSVFGQSFCDFEYIIVDGASTDGSTTVAESSIKAQTLISDERILYSSEPDSGIYNAMNKGIEKASGEYLLFLNSGDCLEPGCLEKISPVLNEGHDFVIGRENITRQGFVQSTTETLTEKSFTLYNLFLYGIPHQASFIRRTLFDDRRYDENLTINADWKFFVERIVFGNASVRAIDTVISEYDGDGISSTNMDKLLLEREAAFKEIVPARIADDYLEVFPHYYEVKRIEWLLCHRFFYKIYRFIASIGMKFSR